MVFVQLKEANSDGSVYKVKRTLPATVPILLSVDMLPSRSVRRRRISEHHFHMGLVRLGCIHPRRRVLSGFLAGNAVMPGPNSVDENSTGTSYLPPPPDGVLREWPARVKMQPCIPGETAGCPLWSGGGLVVVGGIGVVVWWNGNITGTSPRAQLSHGRSRSTLAHCLVPVAPVRRASVGSVRGKRVTRP